jgi:hypothetical protein
MVRTPGVTVSAVALFSCLFTFGQDAEACSVCLAGDPIFDSNGASAQEQGDFNAYLEIRGLRKKSGALPHGDEEGDHPDEGDGDHHESTPIEENISRRLTLLTSWTPLDRLTLALRIPAVFNDVIEFEDDDSERLTLRGLGDISLAATWTLWRNRDILPSTWLEGRAFLKFPSGPSEQKTNGVLDKHVQTGTGSWDFGFGLAGVHRFSWATAFTSVSYRINTEGSLDYEYGDVGLWNAALLAPLDHFTESSWLRRMTPGLELNYRWAQKDDFAGGKYQHSGGSILYVTPQLRIALPWQEESRQPSVRAAIQVPLTSAWLNGIQKEYPVWSVGLFFPF